MRERFSEDHEQAGFVVIPYISLNFRREPVTYSEARKRRYKDQIASISTATHLKAPSRSFLVRNPFSLAQILSLHLVQLLAKFPNKQVQLSVAVVELQRSNGKKWVDAQIYLKPLPFVLLMVIKLHPVSTESMSARKPSPERLRKLTPVRAHTTHSSSFVHVGGFL